MLRDVQPSLRRILLWYPKAFLMYVVTISLYCIIPIIRTLALDTLHRSSPLHSSYRSSYYAPYRSSSLSSPHDAHQSTRVRRHSLASFTVSRARSLLGRVFPGFRRSQSSTAEPTALLQQRSRPMNVSIPEPADIAVPATQDNQVCHPSVFLQLLNANGFHRPLSPTLPIV